MIYKELTVYTTTEGADLIAMILNESGSDGVSIYDSSDIIELIKSDIIWDYIDESLLEKNEVVKVKGYYESTDFQSVYPIILSELDRLKANSPFELGSLETVTIDIDDEDWINVWKKYYKPIHIRNIVIVPNWLNYEAKSNEKAVYMDPGMAFGTGEHESTKICLTLLGELNCSGKKVLDIGTGSGILGLAAAMNGAESVYMSDIDDIAVNAAKANAAINKLPCPVRIEKCNLIDKADIKGDIILANITADVLIKLSEDIGKCLIEEGYIILSGIINSRYDEVSKAYLDAGYTIIKDLTMGEWRGILLQK